MKMDADNRRVWRERWLGSIRELSDIGTQRATWLNHQNPNPHYSYVEYHSSYLDDLTIDGWGGYFGLVEQQVLTPQEAGVALRLHEMLDRYESPTSDNYDHVAILDDTAWIAITIEAEAVRLRLLEMVPATAERVILTEYPLSALQASATLGSS